MKGKTKFRKRRLFERSVVLYLFVLISALAFTSYLGFIYHKNFRETLVRQWLQQLGATIDVTALRIENFNAQFSSSLVSVSHNPVIKQRTCEHDTSAITPSTYCPLLDLYELHKGEVNAILLLDTTGNIIRRFPVDTGRSFLGETCLSRVETERLLDEDEVYVSETFTNRKGIPAITISCPVYSEGLLVGILRWMVSIEKIANNYIKPIRIGNGGYLWLLDDENIIRFHPDSSFKNKLLNNLSQNEQFRVYEVSGANNELPMQVGDYIKEMQQGALISYMHQGVEELCLFRTVKMGNREWHLMLSIPQSNISDPIRRHALTTFWMEALILLLFGLFAYIFYLTQKRKAHLEVEAKYLAELAASEEQLKNERQRRLTAAIDGQEIERNRIARELHDGIGQYLVAIKVKLQSLLSDESKPESENVESINQLTGIAVEEVKRISENLMPRMLDEFGLVVALRRLCDEATNASNIEVDFVSFGVDANAEKKFKTHLYRIVQEALSNALKHSKANHIDIQLLGNPQQLTLLVQDDGVGFHPDAEEFSHGNGLKNIVDRVRVMEGELEIISSPGNGTGIRVKVQSDSWTDNE